MNNSELYRMIAALGLSAAAVIAYLKIEGNNSKDQDCLNYRLMDALEECIAAHKTKPEVNIEVAAAQSTERTGLPMPAEHAPLVDQTIPNIEQTFVDQGTQNDDGRYELSYGMCTFIYDPAARRIFVKGDDYRCFCDQVLAGLAGNPLEEKCEDNPVNLAVASRMPEPVAPKTPEYVLEPEESRPAARESAAADCSLPFNKSTEETGKSWNWQYAEPGEDEERIPTWRETFSALENGIAKK